jgi:hypothetical protein
MRASLLQCPARAPSQDRRRASDIRHAGADFSVAAGADPPLNFAL